MSHKNIQQKGPDHDVKEEWLSKIGKGLQSIGKAIASPFLFLWNQVTRSASDKTDSLPHSKEKETLMPVVTPPPLTAAVTDKVSPVITPITSLKILKF